MTTHGEYLYDNEHSNHVQGYSYNENDRKFYN